MSGRNNGGDRRLSAWAHDPAESLLAEPSPQRWAHSKAVFAEAARLTPILGDDRLAVARSFTTSVTVARRRVAVVGSAKPTTNGATR